MKSKKDRRFSNTTGSEYDTLFTKAYPHYNEFQKAISNAVVRVKDDSFTALEIGCGPGETTEAFVKQFPNASVIAVDNEPIMTNQAKVNLQDYPNVKVIQSDALKYIQSLKSNSIDIFFSGYTIHNFNREYRLKVLKELYRVLAHGGVFVNGDKYALDNLKKRYDAFNWSIQRYLIVYPKYGRGDVCYDWIVHMGEDELPDRIMPESESKEIMKEIGFKDIKITYRKYMEAVLVAKK